MLRCTPNPTENKFAWEQQTQRHKEGGGRGGGAGREARLSYSAPGSASPWRRPPRGQLRARRARAAADATPTHPSIRLCVDSFLHAGWRRRYLRSVFGCSENHCLHAGSELKSRVRNKDASARMCQRESSTRRLMRKGSSVGQTRQGARLWLWLDEGTSANTNNNHIYDNNNSNRNNEQCACFQPYRLNPKPSFCGTATKRTHQVRGQSQPQQHAHDARLALPPAARQPHVSDAPGRKIDDVAGVWDVQPLVLERGPGRCSRRLHSARSTHSPEQIKHRHNDNNSAILRDIKHSSAKTPALDSYSLGGVASPRNSNSRTINAPTPTTIRALNQITRSCRTGCL